jgi:hypothetical protein
MARLEHRVNRLDITLVPCSDEKEASDVECWVRW